MSALIHNTVASVKSQTTLLLLLPADNRGWARQFSEEGYNVIALDYPTTDTIDSTALEEHLEENLPWGLITYGLLEKDAGHILQHVLNPRLSSLKCCVHYNPIIGDGRSIILQTASKKFIPTIFHLSTSQEALAMSLVDAADPASTFYTYALECNEHPPVSVHSYPGVSAAPAFPLLYQPPTDMVPGEPQSFSPQLRSANNLAHTRTLTLTKRYLGPIYDFETLWEKHTYYEFAERDAAKTMKTMVAAPYVNHVPTMTGGVGYRDLSRFYKYHFVESTVTPPDTELIPVSRTVGSDRIIDEMIFKCTHTTEMDYFVPNIPPTNKPFEIALVGIIAFRGDKLYFEHLYWDQASVLVQLGLLNPTGLPIAGIETAKKVLDPYGVPSNILMPKWQLSEGRDL